VYRFVAAARRVSKEDPELWRRHRWARALATALAVAVFWLAGPEPAGLAEEFVLHFPPVSFEILNPNTGQAIGYGKYTVEHVTAGALLKGESHFLNGDYDAEEDEMVITPERPVPALASFRHTFYRKDGSIEREGRADIRSGAGWCETTEHGRQEIESAKFEFPSDTYAGASILIPIQDYLERGETSVPLHLHVFSCVPGPKLLEIEAQSSGGTRWPHYPGTLVRVKVTPDFGFWNLFLRPFIPKITAWFDPAAGWDFVGADLERYYRGPKIRLVKAH
jgi:hypothetical protein